MLAISKGETYLTYNDGTDSPCKDYDYSQQNKAQCENYNGPTVVSNIFFDGNGDIDLIVVFLFWISLTSIMFFVVFQKLTSEHVLSGILILTLFLLKGFHYMVILMEYSNTQIFVP